jgi:hypothetical protein
MALTSTSAARTSQEKQLMPSFPHHLSRNRARRLTWLYFGFLRRDAEAAGFDFWLQRLNSTNHDFGSIVGGFLNSDEYHFRFAFVPAP